MLQSIEIIGTVAGISGWVVNTRHQIDGWQSYYVETPEVDRPVFEEGPTVCYTFPTRSQFYGAIHRANGSGSITPPFITTVPTVVTIRQMRQALFGAGMLTGVNAAIDALPEPGRTIASIQWEYAQDIERFNAFVDAVQALMGLTDDQVDALFIAAGAQ